MDDDIKPAKWRHWTPEDDLWLEKLVAQGMRLAAVALRLGRTYYATKHRISMKGIGVPYAMRPAERSADAVNAPCHPKLAKQTGTDEQPAAPPPGAL